MGKNPFKRIKRRSCINCLTNYEVIHIIVILADYDTGEYLCQVEATSYYGFSTKVDLRVFTYSQLKQHGVQNG